MDGSSSAGRCLGSQEMQVGVASKSGAPCYTMYPGPRGGQIRKVNALTYTSQDGIENLTPTPWRHLGENLRLALQNASCAGRRKLVCYFAEKGGCLRGRR